MTSCVVYTKRLESYRQLYWTFFFYWKSVTERFVRGKGGWMQWKELRGWMRGQMRESLLSIVFTLVTRRPYCPGRPKELCFTTLSLALETMGMRLSVVKQSFFGPPGQYGRLVTRANCQLRRFVVSSCSCRPFVVHFIGNKQNDNFRFSFDENALFKSILIFKHEAGWIGRRGESLVVVLN